MGKDIEIVIKISVPHEFGGSIKVDSNTEKKDHLGLSDFDRKELEKWKELFCFCKVSFWASK